MQFSHVFKNGRVVQSKEETRTVTGEGSTQSTWTVTKWRRNGYTYRKSSSRKDPKTKTKDNIQPQPLNSDWRFPFLAFKKAHVASQKRNGDTLRFVLDPKAVNVTIREKGASMTLKDGVIEVKLNSNGRIDTVSGKGNYTRQDGTATCYEGSMTFLRRRGVKIDFPADLNTYPEKEENAD